MKSGQLAIFFYAHPVLDAYLSVAPTATVAQIKTKLVGLGAPSTITVESKRNYYAEGLGDGYRCGVLVILDEANSTLGGLTTLRNAVEAADITNSFAAVPVTSGRYSASAGAFVWGGL